MAKLMLIETAELKAFIKMVEKHNKNVNDIMTAKVCDNCIGKLSDEYELFIQQVETYKQKFL